MQRGIALLAVQVDLSASSQQRIHHVKVATCGGRMQGRSSLLAGFQEVCTHASGEQGLHTGQVAGSRGLPQQLGWTGCGFACWCLLLLLPLVWACGWSGGRLPG